MGVLSLFWSVNAEKQIEDPCSCETGLGMRKAHLIMRRIIATLVFIATGLVMAPAAWIGHADARADVQASEQLLNQGVGKLESGNYAEAVVIFQQAATANPKNAEAFSYIGRSYDEAGFTSRAYRYYQIALEIDPDELQALSWSGAIDVANEEPDQAREKLYRLERLCGEDCSQYQELKAVVDTLTN